MADIDVPLGFVAAAYFAMAVIGAWVIWRSYRISAKNCNVRALIKQTLSLPSNPKVGSIISFEGHIQSPHATSGFFGTSCSVWNGIVRAIFFSKKKKPATGTTKHQPVIYRNGNQSEPLIVSNRQATVVLLVDKVLSHVVNPQLRKMTKKHPPTEEVKALAKAKYEKYEISEAYLPAKSRVTILGVVVDVDNAYTIVSGHRKIDAPVIVYAGSKQEMLSYYNKRCMSYFGLAMLNLSIVVACWGVQKPILLFLSLPLVIFSAYKLKDIKQ